jgi:cell division transport system permease protein
MIGALKDSRTSGPLLPQPRGMIWYYFALGCLAFVAAIAIGTLLSSPSDMAGPQNRAFTRVTVQIMPDGAGAPPAEIPAALAVLNATPGIASAAVLSESDNSALVAPWLGTNLSARDLPFPILIDVKLTAGAGPDLPNLRKRLVAAAPHAVVDAPRQSRGGIVAFSSQSFSIAVLLLAGTTLAFAISFACLLRAQIVVHRKTLELLLLMGAKNARVVHLVTTRPVIATLIASLVGTAVAAGLFSLPEISERSGIRVNLLGPGLSSVELAWLAFIPVTAAIIVWLTGRLLTMSALRRF